MANREKNRIANWMIMVYLAADDVLSDFAVGSLQQLRQLAGEDADVIVAAQFDANGQQNIPRLIFNHHTDRNRAIRHYKKDEIAADTDMADPAALRDFINWAYEQHKANHYCLVLWGHGPELLTSDYPVLPNGKKAKKFLTPCDIKQALAATKLKRDDRKFEIVAIDACNMSMMELACEIPSYAEFLVASQEEVPDFSFPYDKLSVFGNRHTREDIERTCREIPCRYIDAYQDYIFTRAKQTESITLSSFSLKNAETVTQLLGQLSDAFLKAGHDNKKRQAIMDARANTKDFVAGLYVDLYDFCERLNSELFSRNIADEKLRLTCEQMRDALQARGEDAFILENKVAYDQRCHGVSIYFPHLNIPAGNMAQKNLLRDGTNLDVNRSEPAASGRRSTDALNRKRTGTFNKGRMEASGRSKIGAASQSDTIRIIRGGLDALNKGGMDALNKGGMDALNKVRRQRIEETEQYYAGLELAKKTRWDEFLRHGWSRWLAEETAVKAELFPQQDMSGLLDQQYSAQQCALNLLSLCRKLEEGKKTAVARADEGNRYRDSGKATPVNGSTLS